MQIGIAGMGRMGTAMAGRLLESGHNLTVWSRTAAHAAPLVAQGAAQAESAAALAAGCDIIRSVLSDDAAVEAVYLGPEGLLAGECAGKIFVEMSTVLPASRAALAQAVAARGAVLIECPVGGTVKPAQEGKLLGFAAGPRAAVDTALPVLEALCRRVSYLGEIGKGAAFKLAINLPLIAYWQVLGESLSLFDDLALSDEAMIEAMADTSGASNALKARAPFLARALAGEVVPGTFDLALMRKDLALIEAHASARGATLPVAAAVSESLDASLAAGLGAVDGVTHAASWRQRHRG